MLPLTSFSFPAFRFAGRRPPSTSTFVSTPVRSSCRSSFSAARPNGRTPSFLVVFSPSSCPFASFLSFLVSVLVHVCLLRRGDVVQQTCVDVADVLPGKNQPQMWWAWYPPPPLLLRPIRRREWERGSHTDQSEDRKGKGFAYEPIGKQDVRSTRKVYSTWTDRWGGQGGSRV